MNKDVFEGNWKQLRGKIKESWGWLTDDDLDKIGGQYEQLSGRIQEHYGWGKEEAERELDDFIQRHQAH
jgi:uncharacterized protein YjbJ (UPF0337 family)